MIMRKAMDGLTVNMIGKYFCLVQPEDLEHFRENSAVPPVQIYMVARRPRISLDSDSIKVDDETITGKFVVNRGENTEIHSFTILNQLGTSQIRFESPAPHNMFFVYDENNELISMGKAANLIPLCKEPLEELLNLEVMFVGQTFGVEDAQTNLKKIKEIKSLQAVCADIELKTPDQDIWLVLWNFEQMSELSATNPEFMSPEEESLFLKKTLGERITAQQAVNFTEAALVKFFLPEYNDTSKYDFENKAKETYPECYNLDVNLVIIELNTEEINCQLWSSQVEPDIMQYVHFSMNSPVECKDLFTF